MKNLNLLLLGMVFASTSAFSQSHSWIITDDSYDQSNVGIATYNLMDEPGADNTGTKNMYGKIDTLLKKIGTEGGGVLYLPAGTYLVSPSSSYRGLTIPKGVTIRGDWKRPLDINGNAKPVEGTIIKTDIGEGMATTNRSTFIMQPSTGLMNLTIWHYKQDPGNIKQYPPAVLMGETGYWGNDYCHVRNVTFVNSYIAVMNNASNGGGGNNVHNVYGTVFYKGIDLDNVAEVCRFDFIHWSPKYWAASGLPGAPATTATGNYAQFMKNNATGIEMRRNDWSYTSFLEAEGLKIGFHALASAYEDCPNNTGGCGNYPTPNGHNYGFFLKDCGTAVLCDNTADVGIMFTDIKTENCSKGIVVNVNSKSTCNVQLSNCVIDADTAILVSEKANAKLMTYQTEIKRGRVLIQNSDYSSVDGDFNNAKPQVEISRNARVILTGNRFSEGDSIKNGSFYNCEINHNPITTKTPPLFTPDDAKDIVTKPYKNKVFVVTRDYDAEAFYLVAKGTYTLTFPYHDGGIVRDSVWSISDKKENRPAIRSAYNNALAYIPDATSAIQAALDDAESNGGGIVYLPAGHYKVLGRLNIPEGVELKGANDVGCQPSGPGTVLEVYDGKNNADGEPFITMAPNSGIRGIVFNYPEQDAFDLPADFKKEYPYTIRGNAGTYIVNVSMHTAYQAIDLFTNKCDNYFMDYLSGQPFKNTVRVGGGTVGGRIYNIQTNWIAFNNGGENKYGSWPNSPWQDGENTPAVQKLIRDYIASNHDFIILGDCSEQILYNNFGFAAYRGVWFKNEGNGPSGKSLGQGVDAGITGLYFEALDMNKGGFDMINSQIVALKDNGDKEKTDKSAYIQTAESFTGEANIFSSDYWGNPVTGLVIGGGTLNLYTAHSNAQLKYIKIEEDGYLNLVNTCIGGLSLNKINLASNISVSYSVADRGNASAYKDWIHNLSTTKMYVPNYPPMLEKTGWIAYASENNTDAQKSIDYNTATSWQSSTYQTNSHWYCVNMRKQEKFNTIIMDANNSSTSYVRKFDIYISNDSIEWTKIVAGQSGGKFIILDLPYTYEAQYIKIQSTTNSSYRWAIYEFDIANTESTPIYNGILNNYADNTQASVYYKNGTLFIDGIEKYPVQVSVYNIAGQQIINKTATNNTISTGELKPGIYILTIKQNNKYFNGKFFVK